MAERLRALTIAHPTVQGSLNSGRRDKSGGAIYCKLLYCRCPESHPLLKINVEDSKAGIGIAGLGQFKPELIMKVPHPLRAPY
jgi:hypothetical protein